MASGKNGTIYAGVTSDLIKRVDEHKNGLAEGFSKRYHVHDLVWYEAHQSAETALTREKQIKKWNRSWKLELIEERNPRWSDLYKDLINVPGFPLSRE